MSPGDRIRLRGKLGPHRFPIEFTCEPSDNNVEVPKPKPVEFQHLQAGHEDSQFVEIEAQLVGVDAERYQSCLEMRADDGGRFRALIHHTRTTSESLRAMLGKRLRLRGVVGARLDEQNRWAGFQIWLSVPENIEELDHPGEPLEMQVTPITKLTRDNVVASRSSFFRTEGVATYQLSPSMVLLQDESEQLFVELQKPDPIALGQAYDVRGCLDTSVMPPILRMATLEPSKQKFVISRSAQVQTVESLVAGDFSGQFVHTTGKFSGPFEYKGQQGFLLRANDALLPVFVEGGSLGAVSTGTNVEVEGIWVQQRSLVGFNIGSCALHARINDVRIGTQTPWLLFSVLGGLSTVCLASCVWAVTLRRLVRRRTQQFLESVTEQRRTEEQYANVFINARVMVMTTDQRGMITAVNPAALRTVRREEKQLIGLHVTDLVDDESKQVLQDLLIRSLESDKPSTCNVKLLDAAGSVIPQEVNCWSTSHEGATDLHLIWHDVSERLRIEQQRLEMEQQLISMQKMESLGVLAGGIAHDFNNLLTVIVSNASLLNMSPDLQLQSRDFVSSIQQASQRAAELTQQMLAYAGRGRCDIGVIDFSKIVSEMSQLLTASISKNQKLQLELQSELPGVKGDATQLRQILMNLVRNASEAMANNNGTIRIRTFTAANLPQPGANNYFVNFTDPQGTSETTHFVCLEVSDQGIGIDPANLSNIFDPFFTTKFSGRGLGLAMVCGIVRAHQGYLEVRSQPGQGAIFRIGLRACSESITPSPAMPQTASRPLTPAHVMVVDDEPQVLAALKKTLEFSGLKVTCCQSAEQAIALLDETTTQLDCLITDQTMPGMSGLELCQTLSRRGLNLPAILVSGYSVDLVNSDCTPPCIKAFLQKPYGIHRLIESIQSVVSLHPQG